MGELTLQEALDEYQNVYMAYRNFAERTRVEYLNDLESFIAFAEKSGASSVEDLQLPIIHRYIAQLEHKGYSSLTRKRKAVTIRSFLSFLYQDGYLEVNLAKKVILPFTVNPIPKILSLEECNRLKKACTDNPRDRAIIDLLLETGIKLSELTRLTTSDIEMIREGETISGTIKIIGRRRNKDRVLSINIDVVSAIKDYFKVRQESNSNIIFLNRFGKPMGERGLQKTVKKYFNKVGISNGSVHTLRHTYGYKNLTLGMNPKKVQEMMGLADKRSMSMYVHFSETPSYFI